MTVSAMPMQAMNAVPDLSESEFLTVYGSHLHNIARSILKGRPLDPEMRSVVNEWAIRAFRDYRPDCGTMFGSYLYGRIRIGIKREWEDRYSRLTPFTMSGRLSSEIHRDKRDGSRESERKAMELFSGERSDVYSTDLADHQTPPPDANLDRIELIGKLSRALEKLPLIDRECLKGRFGIGMEAESAYETAERIGVSRQRVDQRVFHALRKLRDRNPELADFLPK